CCRPGTSLERSWKPPTGRKCGDLCHIGGTTHVSFSGSGLRYVLPLPRRWPQSGGKAARLGALQTSCPPPCRPLLPVQTKLGGLAGGATGTVAGRALF